MRRTKQGGSILGYVIVGGVLTVLLLAGAYALRNNWSGTPADKVATQPAGKQSDPKTEEKKESPQGQVPAPQPTAPATPAPVAPKAPTTPNAQQLPQTGPADTLLSVSILVIIMASFGLYLQSRRVATSL
jgi:LPXTG-motif cell wall-anchored protein